MAKITCFGEVLWDVFPTHKKIGGAPLNVASRLASFKNDVHLISSVGNDDPGKVILDFLNSNSVNTNFIQINNEHPTGDVNVTLDKKGAASYDIMFPRAWDYMTLNKEIKALVDNSDALIFGSLVARNSVSRNTLLNILDTDTFKVFDVNLRPPHYNNNLLTDLMKRADFIKLNDEELFEISNYLGSKEKSIESHISYISDITNTAHICVTKGAEGAVLFYNNAFFYNPGYPVTVTDTVGAGDSFLATLIHHILCNDSPQKSIDMACAIGALVAQSEGANPVISNEDIEKFMNVS